MKIEGTLEKTDWGLVLNLKGTELEEIGARAFLDASKNYRDYAIGEKYVGKIQFSVTYTVIDPKKKNPDGNKNWTSFKRDDLEEIFRFIESADDNYKNVYGKKINKNDIGIYFE